MTVPTQQQLHRPILEFVAQPQLKVVSLQQIRSALIQQFSLDDNDLAESVPSGQNRFLNRVYWAVSYLKRGGLLEATSIAHFRITPQGRRALTREEGEIESKYLKDLIDARIQHLSPESEEVAGAVENAIGATPDEQMATLFEELIEKLADEILESVAIVQPSQFESLVVALLEKMGYGEGQVLGRSGDGGIDGIINQDQLGLEQVYVQAKRWKNPVGEPEIRNFAGSLSARGARKGVFITTSSFVHNARETAKNISAGIQFIRLIDGPELARLMIKFDIGVVTETTFYVKKLDGNFFSEVL